MAIDEVKKKLQVKLGTFHGGYYALEIFFFFFAFFYKTSPLLGQGIMFKLVNYK